MQMRGLVLRQVGVCNSSPARSASEAPGENPSKQTKNVTLWLFDIAMENGPFIDDFPIKTTSYRGFSMAMLNNQMVYLGLILVILKYTNTKLD